jgi:cytochrome c peroxidase
VRLLPILGFLVLLQTPPGGVRVPLGLEPLAAPDSGDVALGRRLFADVRMSRDGTVACRSCHRPELAFTDAVPRAVGVHGREGLRNTPTLVNRAFGSRFSLDGRFETLEAQVLAPIQNPLEMDLPLAEAAARVGLPPEAIARGLSAYVRSILSGNSRVDRYLAGDREALSSGERAGLLVFEGQANCTACHSGSNFTDDALHNTGVSWIGGLLADPGAGRGAFKTPTLRDVARTGPYMHDGSFTSLSDVIDFYDRADPQTPFLDPLMRPLRLSQQAKHDLQLFLMALSGDIVGGGDVVVEAD